ncbi:MAG: CDGSH iron-sulfur domain-containing protein [Oculatellaceae cyanobacterium Prado106]|jgi:CDGSH-type Zn-finger protein|nr:CDGSH iron-sulfur domain-containing protein [Oculatellaceae cyanobacterium Prado106]
MSHSSQSASSSIRLDAGTHWICTCGASKNFPHCDGSHKGTAFQPLALELETAKIVEISK